MILDNPVIKTIAKVLLPIVLLLSVIAIPLWKENRNLKLQLSNSLHQIEVQDLNLGRALTEVGDAQARLSELSKEIQDDIGKKDKKVVRYIEVEAKHDVSVKDAELKVGVVVSDTAENKSSLNKILTPEDVCPGVEKLPFLYQDFRLKVYGDCIVRIITYELSQTFTLKVLETVDKNNNRSHYALLEEVTPDGKVKLKLTKFQVIIDRD